MGEVVETWTAEEWLEWLRLDRKSGPSPLGLRDCADAIEAELKRLRALVERYRE